MSLRFHCSQHFQAGRDLGCRHMSSDGGLETDEMPTNDARHFPSFARRVDDERAAVLDARHARDQSAVVQAIEDARQRRAFVREVRMQFRDRRRRGSGQVGEDVRFPLRQAVLLKISEIETDPVRRTVNRRNELERHRMPADRVQSSRRAPIHRRAARQSSTQRGAACPSAAPPSASRTA